MNATHLGLRTCMPFLVNTALVSLLVFIVIIFIFSIRDLLTELTQLSLHDALIQ